MGIRQKFADWIRQRIDEIGAEECVDYVIHKFVNNPLQGGRPQIDYYVTPDMAKEMGMLERNARGRAISGPRLDDGAGGDGAAGRHLSGHRGDVSRRLAGRRNDHIRQNIRQTDFA